MNYWLHHIHLLHPKMARKTELLHPANYFWCERGDDGPGWETVMKICLEKSFSEEFVHTPSNKSLANKVRKPRFDSQVVTISFIYSVWIYKVPTHDQLPLASTSRFKRRERERERRNLTSLGDSLGPPLKSAAAWTFPWTQVSLAPLQG